MGFRIYQQTETEN